MSASQIEVLIVDDEEPARRGLREVLAREPGVRVVRECANGIEALKAAAERAPDVIFLDVEMPGLDGFEVLELLPPGVAVVFVTAFDHYAVRAFEVHAVDYVLKPFREERLRAALVRARERAVRGEQPDPARLAAAVRAPGATVQRLAVREGRDVHVVAVAKLDYAEARDDLVLLVSEGKRFARTQTLGALAASLDPRRFLRVHRSFVVNVDRIRRIEEYSKNSRVAVLADGSRIPISREGYARLKERLGS